MLITFEKQELKTNYSLQLVWFSQPCWNDLSCLLCAWPLNCCLILQYI